MPRFFRCTLATIALCVGCSPYPDIAIATAELEVMKYEARDGEVSRHRLIVTGEGDNSTYVSDAEIEVSLLATDCSPREVGVDLHCRAFGDGEELPFNAGDGIPQSIEPPGTTYPIRFHNLTIPMTMTCDLELSPYFEATNVGCIEWAAEAWAEYVNGDLVLSLDREEP